jgi:hypothetical protein
MEILWDVIYVGAVLFFFGLTSRVLVRALAK